MGSSMSRATIPLPVLVGKEWVGQNGEYVEPWVPFSNRLAGTADPVHRGKQSAPGM